MNHQFRVIHRVVNEWGEPHPWEARHRLSVWLSTIGSLDSNEWHDARWEFFVNDPYWGPLVMIEILGGGT